MNLLTLDRVVKRYRRRDQPAVDGISVGVRAGELFTFLGESGSGKTTTLRLIAGFEVPDSGTISIGERVVSSTAIFVPPEKRQVRVVFQESTLFPHLAVGHNVAFALEDRRGANAGRIVQKMLALVGLPDCERRFPHELSGGERQRVELARALASGPTLLLLDEPFSNLDQALKVRLREDTTRILREAGATTILVTHDIEDALAVSDRLAVLRHGRIEQLGPPEEVYRAPRNAYVAGFFGPTNLLAGRARPGGFETGVGQLEGGPVCEPGCQVTLSIRPEDWLVLNPGDAKSASVRGRVESVNFLGRTTELVLEVGRPGTTTRLRVHSPGLAGLIPGAELAVRPRADRIHVLPE